MNYTSGQVYVYDYNPELFDGDAETFVFAHHSPDDVHYMVHKYTPALWTKNLYFCSREEAYRLAHGDDDDEDNYTEYLPPRER